MQAVLIKLNRSWLHLNHIRFILEVPSSGHWRNCSFSYWLQHAVLTWFLPDQRQRGRDVASVRENKSDACDWNRSLCLIATGERSCQMITDAARGCSLSEGSDEQTVRWSSTSQQFVYSTVWLKGVTSWGCIPSPLIGAQNKTEILMLAGHWQEFSLPKGSNRSNFRSKTECANSNNSWVRIRLRLGLGLVALTTL